MAPVIPANPQNRGGRAYGVMGPEKDGSSVYSLNNPCSMKTFGYWNSLMIKASVTLKALKVFSLLCHGCWNTIWFSIWYVSWNIRAYHMTWGGHLATIWIYHHAQKHGKGCVFQYWAGYRADPYEIMLFWDKRGSTFWCPEGWCKIWASRSYNLQNDRGRWSSESEVIFWSKLNLKGMWSEDHRTQTLVLKELNKGLIYFSYWIGVCFWEVVGKKGLNLVYI